MAPPEVRTVKPSELGKLTDVLTLAFSTDPVSRYGYPNGAKQGQGNGAALLEQVLAIVDKANAVAYLESSNPKNMSLYERAGFETVAKIQINDAPGE